MKTIGILLLLFLVVSGCETDSPVDVITKSKLHSSPFTIKKTARLYGANGTLGDKTYDWGYEKFDINGRLIEEVYWTPFSYFRDSELLMGKGTKNTFLYSSDNNLLEKSIGDNLYKYEYENGHLTKIKQYKWNNSSPEPTLVQITHYKYNEEGLIMWEGNSLFDPFLVRKDNTSQSSKLIRYKYDDKQNVVEKLYIDNWSGKPYYYYEDINPNEGMYQREIFEYNNGFNKPTQYTKETSTYNAELKLFEYTKEYTETKHYNASGQLTFVENQIFRGSGSVNNLIERYEYDSKGFLLVQENKGELTHQISTYTRNELGEILTEHIQYKYLGSSILEPRDWLLISYVYERL